MSSSQYFLLKDGGTQQPLGRFEGGPMALDFLWHGPLFSEVEPPIPTPDGGRIRIFENASAGPDVFFPASQANSRNDLSPVHLNFGNEIGLTGVRVSEKEGVFTLALRWRCLNGLARPLRCFVHVVGADGKLLGSMDHEILHGSPPVQDWQPQDEGYEARYLALTPASAQGAKVRIGLFDPETRLRVPVWASTAALKDDYTAAVLEPNEQPGVEYKFEMSPAPMVQCDVRFQGGLKLTAYSVRRAGDIAWVRLEWSAPRPPKQKLYFFGHAVMDQSPDTPILLSFDQDTGLNRIPPSRYGDVHLIQDVVRDVSKLDSRAKFLRAGIFDFDQPLDRLNIRSSSLASSARQKAIYIPLPPAQ
jgi:hypothetical protein